LLFFLQKASQITLEGRFERPKKIALRGNEVKLTVTTAHT
jgi:hypothetical protein